MSNDCITRARDLPSNAGIVQWVVAQENHASAVACVRYALAFNTLDMSWLKHALSPFVTYESQSVFDKLSGTKQVWGHLAGKVDALQRSRALRPRFELAITQMGEPCAAGFQPQGAYDRNWLQQPLTSVVFETDARGLITSILVITVAPATDSAKRSGIYPGVEGAVQERPRGFVRPGADYQGLRFVFFLLDGKTGLDQQMRKTAEAVASKFPGAECQVLVWQEMRGDEYQELHKAQFTGFPSVAVYYRNQGIFRKQGLISAEALTSAIQDATLMFVVSSDPTL